MIKAVFIGVFIFALSNPIITFADTVDVWTVRLNGKAIINSNESDILYGNHPMELNLHSLKDSDILQICYWTDSDLETNKWHYFFKDINNSIIDKFTNPIDSSVSKTYNNRKNFISFGVQALKQLMKVKNINKIFVEFQQDNTAWNNSYLDKSICIITNN